MKPIKILFLLSYLTFTPFIVSCSSEATEPETSNDRFEAFINDSHFNAKDVALILRGDYIDIIGNDLENNQSIFLTLKRSNKDLYIFGHSDNNKEGNEASLFHQTDAKEFTTSYLNRNCGEVKLDITHWDEGYISGEFYFEASDDNNNTISVSRGSFEKTF